MFHGTVVHGMKYGRRIGYPTANLDVPVASTDCAPGVYAAFTTVAGKKYPSALIVDGGRQQVEVHLLDFTDKDIYGIELEVKPVAKVSDLKSFDSESELKMKIEEDIRLVRVQLTDRD